MSETALPQLDVSSFEAQIFWFFVTFCIFYTYVKSKVSPYFFTEIDSRKMFVENNLAEVRKLQKKANFLSEDYGEKIQAAYLKANDVIVDAKKRSEKNIDQVRYDLTLEAQARLNSVSEDLEKELKGADADICSDIDALFVLASQKLSLEVSKDRIEKMIKETLSAQVN
ncbi:MAG: ATP synthase F0 subunit B [Pseudomonadota bacterium]